MKPFVTYFSKLPTSPKFLAADLLVASIWVWIYLSDVRSKEPTSAWLRLELAVAAISCFLLLAQLAAAFVKWQKADRG